ncbi:MAG: restriction endonuclease [Candidatus Yanofskybacteria bacterium]|nr:restriction endonuclease [Candidatus Yanofskybacteria bacterium]
MSYVIIILFVLGFIIWAIVSIFEWLGKTTKQVKARMSVDTKRNIIERNQDIITECLQHIYDDSWPHYVENKVRDCIGEIAKREGRPELAPKYREWLSVWESRSDIPPEYQELKNHLKKIFKERFDEVKSQAKHREEEREREEKEVIAKDGLKLYERNKDLVDKFLEITERKVSVIDDYGDENWEILPDEILACIKKIAQREGIQIDWQAHAKAKRRGYFSYSSDSLPEEYSWLQDKLEEEFKEYHKTQRNRPAKTGDLNGLSGIEFETWVAKVLKENGFDDVRGTPTTGDQGADLVAKKNGKTIIIQAKRYQGTVGNKAVQEVVSAVGYYGGDEGWVITSSSFTSSAKALAHKLHVHLIDGKDLDKISEKLKALGY